MNLKEAVNNILYIRKRLLRLKSERTISIYKTSEHYFQRHIVLNNACYVNSKNEVIQLEDINPKHAENVINKYVKNITHSQSVIK